MKEFDFFRGSKVVTSNEKKRNEKKMLLDWKLNKVILDCIYYTESWSMELNYALTIYIYLEYNNVRLPYKIIVFACISVFLLNMNLLCIFSLPHNFSIIIIVYTFALLVRLIILRSRCWLPGMLHISKKPSKMSF